MLFSMLRARCLPLFSVVSLCASNFAADLKLGDKLPNCSKIPLLPISAEFRPQTWGVSSLEGSLLFNGVVIVHFLSPRPPRRAAFQTDFVEQLSDLRKAEQSVSYPCRAVAVVPFGEKGRADAQTLIDASDTKPWGDVQVYFEPTFPRPGLYRTFRPGTGADSGGEVATPYTYLIGPDRKIIAVREPKDSGKLYDWLQSNLPETVTAVPKSPSTNLSPPALTPWVWPTFRRSVQHQPTASVLPDVLPYTYLAWQTRVGRTFASPAVVDNVAYVTTDSEGLRSVALRTGQLLMSFSVGGSWWSSPAIVGSSVIAVSNQGTVFCIERSTFKLKWKRDLGGLITSSPVASDGALYVGSRNGAVYALDAATGDVLWSFQTGGEISSSPALMDGTLVIGSGDRSVYALDAKTGALKWTKPTDGPVDSSPAISGGDVFVGSFDGGLYAFKLADGTQNWRCQLGGWVHSSPAVAEDTVFVGTVNFPRDQIASFNWVDRKTGKRLGSFDMPDAVYSSPTIWGDLVLIGCRDYNLYAFDRKMRQTQPAWAFHTLSYLHASPVVVGDTMLLASFDRNLYALRQAKPIRIWTESDIVPRWFVAALTREMHKQTGDLIRQAAAAKIGTELTLKPFDQVFADIRAGASKPSVVAKVLPRDVPPDHPGASHVEYVLTSGLLTGYPDGTFRPNEPTTRYQFSGGFATVVQAVGRPDFAWKLLSEKQGQGAQVEVRIQPTPGRPRSKARDVPGNHWAFQALSDLADRALLPLDEDGNYRGQKIVTLKDAAEHWARFVESVRAVRVK